MQVSKNFSDTEFFKIDTYQSMIQSGMVPAWFIDRRLVQRLQMLRDFFGKPITITRAFATQAENIAVGGAKFSQHLFGRAADFIIAGITSAEIIKFITTNFPDGAYGAITDFAVHIDVRNNDVPLEIKY